MHPPQPTAPRILITEFMDEPAVNGLRARFDVHYAPHLVHDEAGLMAQVPLAQALIVRNQTQVRGALLQAAARLQVVGRLGVGLDNIDVQACARRGVPVIAATGANANAVAEYVLATALVLLRGAYASTTDLMRGAWPRTALAQGSEAQGQTLGLIGFGGIGQCTARLAKAVGMRVIACDPALAPGHPAWRQQGAECLALDAVLKQADVLSLHLPLNEGTRGLLHAGRIASMKPGAILINTARGGIVDEAAAAAALRSGALGGAAFDVFEDETLGAGPVWQGCPRLILTPHVAGLSRQANQRVSAMIAHEVAQALSSINTPA